jgi:putative FmdB family regulatory protein
MPFYEYECSNCKFYSEVMQKISDAPLAKCPSCGKKAMVKLVSAPNFRLKGGGWYETDFKGDKENKRNLAGADRDDSAASKSETSDSSSTKADSTAKAEGSKSEGAKTESATSESTSKAAPTLASGGGSGGGESKKSSSSRGGGGGSSSGRSGKPVSRPTAGKSKVAASKAKPAPSRSKAKPAAKKKARR